MSSPTLLPNIIAQKLKTYFSLIIKKKYYTWYTNIDAFIIINIDSQLLIEEIWLFSGIYLFITN